MWSKIKPYFIGALVGLLVGSICVLAINRGNQSKLERTLDDIKISLGSALLNSGDIAESIRYIRKESENKDRIIAEQQSRIDGQQLRLEAQQRGLEEIAREIQGTGRDIGGQIKIFAEGFGRLYRIYNEGAEVSKTP